MHWKEIEHYVRSITFSTAVLGKMKKCVKQVWAEVLFDTSEDTPAMAQESTASGSRLSARVYSSAQGTKIYPNNFYKEDHLFISETLGSTRVGWVTSIFKWKSVSGLLCKCRLLHTVQHTPLSLSPPLVPRRMKDGLELERWKSEMNTSSVTHIMALYGARWGTLCRVALAVKERAISGTHFASVPSLYPPISDSSARFQEEDVKDDNASTERKPPETQYSSK